MTRVDWKIDELATDSYALREFQGGRGRGWLTLAELRCEGEVWRLSWGSPGDRVVEVLGTADADVQHILDEVWSRRYDLTDCEHHQFCECEDCRYARMGEG